MISIANVARYSAPGATIWRSRPLPRALVGAVIGSWVGAWLLRTLSLGWLRWLFIALLVVVAVRLLLVAPVRGGGLAELDAVTISGMVVLGIVIGIASGLFGIGGGVIMVPAFITLFGMGDLVANAQDYEIGDTAEILITSPFQGTTEALVTVERGDVLYYEQITMDSNSFVYTLPVTEDFAPNVFVSVVLVKGVPKWDRPIYKLWEEGEPPTFVVEVTSDKTRDEDLKDKKGKYLRMGVEEYFLFDPYGDYLDPRLQGYRLDRGRYVSMAPEPEGAILSRTTGLRLEPEGLKLRLVDPATGERLLWSGEKDRALEAERAARLAAEEEIARLRRELERLGRE